MIDTVKIGKRIAKLRKERGLTGEKFAELLDVSPQAVSKWETGKNLPETALLPSISKLLNVSIDSGAILPNEFIASTQSCFPFDAWSKETRINLADALMKCKQLEEQAIGIINDVLKHL